VWIEAKGLKNYLPIDLHFEHLPRFDEDDGVHEGQRPSMGQNKKWNHLDKMSVGAIMGTKARTSGSGVRASQGLMMRKKNYKARSQQQRKQIRTL